MTDSEPMKPDRGGEETLVVSEVFGPTVQGEGPSVGRRAGFVRLGRCNLDCSWCDTPFTWDWDRFDPATELTRRSIFDVVAEVDAMQVDRVVLTGGEPLLQQRSLRPFLAAAADRQWLVEVETNGTVVPLDEVVAAVAQFNVSPKLANSGVAKNDRLVGEALGALQATGKAVFKFVVSDPSELDEVAHIVEDNGLSSIWIMPEGTTSAAVTSGSASLADEVIARGWNLTTRLHVLLWGDQRGR